MKQAMYFVISFIALILVSVIVSGCGGNNASPVFPDVDQMKTEENSTRDISSHSLWMYSEIYIDPGTMEYEVVPVRITEGHWNILKWLQTSPCTDCLKVTKLVPSGNGTLLIDVLIKHPFTNKNFTGFDVRGIAMFNGSLNFPESGLLTQDRFSGEGFMVNAEGFTSLYNSTTLGSGPGGLQGYVKGKYASVAAPNSTLNGFIRYKSSGAENTRNAFYAGNSVTRTVEIKMPSGPFVLGYAVDASWAPPSTTPVNDPITDFSSDANCTEPWNIAVSGNPNLIGGQTTLTIDVYDWQGKSTFSGPVIECPALFNGTVNATWIADGAGYARYEAEINNTKGASDGDYFCLISVEANENDPGSTPWLDLTAYQLAMVTVPGPTGDLIWAESAGGFTPEIGWDAVALSDDSTVIVGYFGGSSTFGLGGPNETTLTVEPGPPHYDVFIARYEKNGNLIWAKSAGGYDTDYGYGITSLSDDSVVITGTFSASSTFGKGEPNETILTAAGGILDVFIAKYDINGALVWAKSAGGPAQEQGENLSRLPGDGVAVTGYFNGTAIFGAGEPNETTLVSAGADDIFIAWYGSDGKLITAKRAGGPGQDEGNAIGTLSDGTVFVSGDFSQTAIFGQSESNETSLVSNGGADIFIAHFDFTGKLDWVKRVGGQFTDSSKDLAVLSDNSFGVTGDFAKTVIFGEGDPNQTTLNSYSGGPDSDIFVAYYNVNGVLHYAKRAGAVSNDTGWSVDGLSDNSLVITGRFLGSVTFGSGESKETTLECASGLVKGDIFVARYKPTGLLSWAKQAGGAADDGAYGITSLSDNSSAVTGFFGDTSTFGPGESNETNLTSSGGGDDPDIFIARFKP